jgi:cell division control protein 6
LVIVKRPEALKLDYVPKELPARERQVEGLRRSLESGECSAVYGPFGSGKTAIVRFVAKAPPKDELVAYIDCRRVGTDYYIIQSMREQFGFGEKLGYSASTLLDEAVRRAGGRGMWLILDEFTCFVQRNPRRSNQFLSTLLDLGVKLTLTSIEAAAHTNLECSKAGRLNPTHITCGPYRVEELTSILVKRAEEAFGSAETIESEAVEALATWSAELGGNARQAIYALKKAAEVAERNGSSKILREHAEQALEKIPADAYFQEYIATLSDHLKAVLGAVAWMTLTNEDTKTGDVYLAYEKACEELKIKSLSWPIFRTTLLPQLTGPGLLIEERWRKRGRTTILKLNPGIKPTNLYRNIFGKQWRGKSATKEDQAP